MFIFSGDEENEKVNKSKYRCSRHETKLGFDAKNRPTTTNEK